MTTPLLLILALAALPPSGDARLLYAFKKDGITTLSSCTVAPLHCARNFSDAGSAVKIMARGGASDSTRVIRTAGARVFAVGTDAGAKAGALYELALDGTNGFRKIAVVESRSPVDRIAVDPQGQKIAYVSQTQDTRHRGEGSSYRVDSVVIVETATGTVLQRIRARDQIGRALVAYLEWGADGDLYMHVEGDAPQDGVFRIDKRGVFQRLGLKIRIIDQLAGQMPGGNFLVARYVSKKSVLRVEDASGKVLADHPQARGGGWFYALTEDGAWLAAQGSEAEIWARPLASSQDAQVVMQKSDYFKEAVSLVGWTGR